MNKRELRKLVRAWDEARAALSAARGARMAAERREETSKMAADTAEDALTTALQDMRKQVISRGRLLSVCAELSDPVGRKWVSVSTPVALDTPPRRKPRAKQ